MAEGTKTLHFIRSVNLPDRRFIAGQDKLLPTALADKLLAHRTKDGEKVAVEAKEEAPPSLERLTRDELNAKADEAGVEGAAEMSNKQEVIAALAEKGVTQ